MDETNRDQKKSRKYTYQRSYFVPDGVYLARLITTKSVDTDWDIYRQYLSDILGLNI